MPTGAPPRCVATAGAGARWHAPLAVGQGVASMHALAPAPRRRPPPAVAAAPEPRPRGDAVLVRPLEVGVCGTDREISEGLFGVAPDGEEALVLGHELLGAVARDGHGFAAGDLVAATVRRSCGQCAPRAGGAPAPRD